MATIANPYNPDEDKANQQQAGGQGQVNTPVSVTGVSPVSGGAGNAAATQAPANPKGTSSGRFTNITSYLKANQNYGKQPGQEGQQGGLGAALVNKYQNEANELSSAIGSSGNPSQTAAGQQGSSGLLGQYGQQAEAGRNKLNQGLLDQLHGDVTSLANDPEKYAQYQKMMSGQYTAADLGDTSQLENKIQKFQQNAGNTDTESGRYNLLKQTFNKPGYGGGQQKLDQVLLQADQGQLGKLSAIKKQSSDIGQQLQKAKDYVASTNEKYSQEAADTAKRTKQELADEQLRQEAQLGLKLQREQAKRDIAQDAFQKELKSGKISKNYGLDTDYTYGVNPLDFYSEGADIYADVNGQKVRNYGAVATDEDRARFNALAKLAGQDTGTVGGYSLDKTNVDPAVNFDVARYKQAVADAKAQYERDLQAFKDSIQYVPDSAPGEYNGNPMSMGVSGNILLGKNQQIADWIKQHQGNQLTAY